LPTGWGAPYRVAGQLLLQPQLLVRPFPQGSGNVRGCTRRSAVHIRAAFQQPPHGVDSATGPTLLVALVAGTLIVERMGESLMVSEHAAAVSPALGFKRECLAQC